MPLVTTRALVLQAFAYSDTSKVLRLFTREHGLRSAIAKGALRPKSRYGGVLEPFTEGDATFYLKDGRELQTLGGFDLVRSRQSLGRDLAAFAGASLLVELLLRYSTEEPHPALFVAATRALDTIAAEQQPAHIEARVLAAAWQIVSLLGYRPETAVCVGCGSEFGADEAARFDAQAGGIACVVCRPGGRTLDPQSRTELARMVDGTAVHPPFARRSLQRDLLQAFRAVHPIPDRPLRSLELFVQTVGDRAAATL